MCGWRTALLCFITATRTSRAALLSHLESLSIAFTMAGRRQQWEYSRREIIIRRRCCCRYCYNERVVIPPPPRESREALRSGLLHNNAEIRIEVSDRECVWVLVSPTFRVSHAIACISGIFQKELIPIVFVASVYRAFSSLFSALS